MIILLILLILMLTITASNNLSSDAQVIKFNVPSIFHKFFEILFIFIAARKFRY